MDDIATNLIILFSGMLLGIITGAIAQKKGGSFFAWWLFGTLLFIVALPMALLMDAKAEGRNSGMKNCPYCGTSIKTSLMKCPNCKRSQPEIGAATDASWQKIIHSDDDVAKWAKQHENKEDSN